MNAKSFLTGLAAMGSLSTECLRAGSDSTVDEVRGLVATPDKKQRVECVSNLKQVAMAIQIWTTHNADSLPPNLLSLSNELASTRLLVCPADATRQAASDWASATTTNLSFKFLAPSATVAAPQQVVLLCPVHGNVSLMDGSVQSRVARTCPERFILKGDQLYFGNPVYPAVEPGTATGSNLGGPEVAARASEVGSGNPPSRTDEEFKRRYGLIRSSGPAPVQTNPPPPAAGKTEPAAPSLAGTSPGSGRPGVRLDEKAMQRFGLLPLSSLQSSPNSGPAANTEAEILKQKLKDPDVSIRRAAVEKLTRSLGEGAQVTLTPRQDLLRNWEATQKEWATVLTGLLKDEDSQVKMGAASALYACGPSAKVALPELIVMLRETNPQFQLIAAHTLSNIGTNASAAVPALEQMMKKTSGQARSTAAMALWRISRNAPLVVPVLVEALQVKSTNYVDTWPAFFAANILAEIGPEAKVSVPALSSVLEAKDIKLRIAAAAALVQISPDTAGLAEVLGTSLQQNPGLFQNITQKALRELGSRSVPALMKAADDPSPVVRRLSIETMGSLGAQASDAVRLLAAKLADSDELVRRAAAEALKDLAPESKAAAAELRVALKDRSGMVRTAAAVALIRLEESANEAVPVLVEAMSDSRDMNAQIVAGRAAGSLSTTAVPMLVQYLKPPSATGADWGVQNNAFRMRSGAIDLLGRMGPNAKAAVPALIQAFEDRRMPQRCEAARSLGWIGPEAKAAIPALKSSLQDPDASLRLESLVALAQIDDQDGSHVAALSECLKNESGSVRIAAVRALGGLGDRAKPAVPELRRLALNDDDESVLREVIQALEAIEADNAKEA